MNEEIREKVIAVEKFKNAENCSAIEACKRMKFPLHSFYTYRRQVMGLPRLYSKTPPQKKQRRQRSVPQLVNVQLPVNESSTISIVVLKGNTEAIREIVTGLGGVFRG